MMAVINEAVELTRRFGATEGHRYVNGVLDRLAAELRAHHPSSGEINFAVADPGACVEAVVAALGARAGGVDRLDGASRPDHFRGVLTVVAKLFNVVGPDVAVFGRKDLQQSVLVRRMARDLNMPVEIELAPIVREEDGLAVSSRNQYLDAEERRRARAVPESLRRVREAYMTARKHAS